MLFVDVPVCQYQERKVLIEQVYRLIAIEHVSIQVGLFVLMHYVQSALFQSCRENVLSSWVESVFNSK